MTIEFPCCILETRKTKIVSNMKNRESEEKGRIIQQALQMSHQFGISKLTMDELAKALKISKKTIYKHFSSKGDLIDKMIEATTEKVGKRFLKIVLSDCDAVEKLQQIGEFMFGFSQRMSRPFLEDLKGAYNDKWRKIEEFRRDFVLENFNTIIVQGQKEGLIENYPTELINRIIFTVITDVVTPDFVLNTNLSINKAAMTTLNIVFNGILTKKGRKIYKKL